MKEETVWVITATPKGLNGLMTGFFKFMDGLKKRAGL
jgi:hypothetical protein